MSKFVSNVIKLGSATVMGQLLGLIIMPLLSRLYSPADFGVYQLFFSIVAFIAVISCFSYSGAINLPKLDKDAANIVILCAALIVITSIISTVFLFTFSGYIEHSLNTPSLANYLFLIPLAIICNSLAYVMGCWLSRRQEFGTIAKGNVISSVVGKTVSVSTGIISPSPVGLIFGSIINDATILIVLLKKTAEDFHIFKEVSYDNIKQIAQRYKKFPQYNAVSDIANVAGVTAIPFMLAYFFSSIIVGYYAMSLLVINMPLKLVGNSLTSVFYQKISVEKKLKGNITNVVKTVHTRLISLGMFSCLIIMIIGPELFAFVLGSKWYNAGIYAQILSPYFFVLFISIPLLSILNVMEKQHVSFWFNIYFLISTIFVLIIGGVYGDPISVMILLSVNGVISWSLMNIYTLKIAEVSVRSEVYEFCRYLSLGLFVCLPLIIAKYFTNTSNMLILIALIISVIYYLIIINQDPQLKQGLLGFIGGVREK